MTENGTELLDAEGNIAATYYYAPFGTVTAAGPAAHRNPIQWSSEHYDPELALVYYNYRHYNPADGRWINRDPIAERGGFNLYGFVGNRSIFRCDIHGTQEQIKIPGHGHRFISGFSVEVAGNAVAYIAGHFNFRCAHNTGELIVDENSIFYKTDGIFTKSKYYVDRIVQHPKPRTRVYQIAVTVAGIKEDILKTPVRVASGLVTLSSLFPGSQGVAFVVSAIGVGTSIVGELVVQDELLMAQIIVNVEFACECDDADVRIKGTNMFIRERHWYPKVKSHTILKIN